MKYSGNTEGAKLSIALGHGNFELPANTLNWSSGDVNVKLVCRLCLKPLRHERIERKYRVREKEEKRGRDFVVENFPEPQRF